MEIPQRMINILRLGDDFSNKFEGKKYNQLLKIIKDIEIYFKKLLDNKVKEFRSKFVGLIWGEVLVYWEYQV